MRLKKGQLLGYLEDTIYKSTYEKNLADIKALTATSTNAREQYERNIPLCKMVRLQSWIVILC